MATEFGVLGSIEAHIDGRLVDLGPARQRLLLAALLIDLNHEVTADQLAERIWGEAPARRGTLHSYLSRLRQALAPAEGVEIDRRPAGYVLTADPAGVDLYRFRHLVDQARGARVDELAADLFGQALELWRGEPLAAMDTGWSRALREDLDHERLSAELDCAEVRLRLGQHSDLLPILRVRAGEYPLDERLAGQLMLALYRCGRPAEALACYRNTRRRLVEKLGIDPSPALRHLHQRILNSDLALTPSAAAAPVPRQLPAPPALFTGRTAELATLTGALEGQGEARGTVVILVIGGAGGIGKTHLALHWAHTHLAHFPDGQLYVNLRGFDPSGEPVPPPVVIRGFLDALGVPSATVPANADDQAALYRSLAAGRRLLVVLDDARDTAQVTGLLPGSPSCTVLVTSRHQLTGLAITHGVKPLALDALSEAEARQLLTRHLGEGRIAREPEAVTALLRHCAGLPLALSIVAARAAAHPHFTLAHLVEQLAEAESQLDARDADELSADPHADSAVSHPRPHTRTPPRRLEAAT